MTDTFPIKSKRKARKITRTGSEDAEDDFSEFFSTKRSSIERRHRDVKVTDASPGPSFLEILIFAVSVCLWLTSFILICCHIIMVTTKRNAYIYMIHQPKMMALLVLQMISIVVEFTAAICATFCISYDVEAHNVIFMAKLAIGFVCSNAGVFTSVLIVGSFASHQANKPHLTDPKCPGSCARGVDVITHLFVGCSYEGIAINLITIPVLVWVLKEAIVFVKLDHEARRAKASVKETPSSTDLNRKEEYRPSANFRRKVRFSQSASSLIDSILPEVKLFKNLPNTSPRYRDNSDMRDAVIRVMSEDLASPEKSQFPPEMNAPAESKRPSRGSFRKTKSPDLNDTDSVSRVDPWSTTSPSRSAAGSADLASPEKSHSPQEMNAPAESKRPSRGSFRKTKSPDLNDTDSASRVDPWSTTSPSRSAARSADLASPEKSQSPPEMNAPAESKRPSRGSFRKSKSPDHNRTDSVSSVDPWSTTSPSTSDSEKDF